MEWVFLFIAGIFEVGWAVCLKFSHGFTKIMPSACTVCLKTASFYFLALALRGLPLGTAYAVWTGIGTLGTVFFRNCIVLRVGLVYSDYLHCHDSCGHSRS